MSETAERLAQALVKSDSKLRVKYGSVQSVSGDAAYVQMHGDPSTSAQTRVDLCGVPAAVGDVIACIGGGGRWYAFGEASAGRLAYTKLADGVAYAKAGHVVTIATNISDASTTANAWTEIVAAIPEEIRPTRGLFFGDGGGYATQVSWRITSAGQLAVWTSAAMTTLRTTMTYVA